MQIREMIHRFVARLLGREEYPVHGACSSCGERVYLPFRCSYCGRYFCGSHHLPFNHDCVNLGEWKRSRNSPKK